MVKSILCYIPVIVCTLIVIMTIQLIVTINISFIKDRKL